MFETIRNNCQKQYSNGTCLLVFVPSKWEHFSDSAPPSLCKFTWGTEWLNLVMTPDCASTFYLCLSVVPLPRCLLPSSCISTDCLVPDAFADMQSSSVAFWYPSKSGALSRWSSGRSCRGGPGAAWAALPLLLHGCVPACPPLGPAGVTPSLPSLQLCSEGAILSPKDEEAAQKLCSFLKAEPIDLSHKLSWFWDGKGCLATVSFLA